MGFSPGEESLKRRRCGSDDRGAAGLRPDRAITEATCVRVLNHKSGRRWRVSVRSGKRSERFGVGKETKGDKRRCRQRKVNRKRPALVPQLREPNVISAPRIEVLRKRP